MNCMVYAKTFGVYILSLPSWDGHGRAADTVVGDRRTCCSSRADRRWVTPPKTRPPRFRASCSSRTCKTICLATAPEQLDLNFQLNKMSSKFKVQYENTTQHSSLYYQFIPWSIKYSQFVINHLCLLTI